MKTKITSKSRLILGAAFGVWVSVVLAVALWMNKYAATAGPAGVISPQWPAKSLLSLSPTNPTLVMFAHPRCSCTRASLGELEILMAGAQGKLSAHVFFFQPEGTSEAWAQTALWRAAAAIPGVSVHTDLGGAEAQRYHAETSGDTLVYGTNGTLLFQGGITLSRGHSGDNAGRDAIEALLHNDYSQPARTPVFGCALSGKECKYQIP